MNRIVRLPSVPFPFVWLPKSSAQSTTRPAAATAQPIAVEWATAEPLPLDVSLTFLGAAHCVTGSKYVLTLDRGRNRQQLLVDCGLFQGLQELRQRNHEPLPLVAADLEAVVLTHAHIDHSGYLPKLVKDGFQGPIFCTDATADLLRILLLDSAKLQEEEAAFANAEGYSKHHPAEPLYTVADAEQVLALLESAPYNQTLQVTDQVQVIFRDAGHILGSAIVEMTLQGARQSKKLVFSGDLGRYNNPVLFDPTPVKEADVLLVESTYGDRNTRIEDPEAELARLINEAVERGGVLLIAAFAVGRTQTLLYYLKKLRQEGRVPQIPVYVDSPMGIRVTSLFRQHPTAHRLGLNNPFDFSGLHFVSDQQQSKALNRLTGPAIIISASGMCTGGRIVHHLHNRLPRPQDTLLLVGYQAEGTRGRSLQDGEKQIKMFGEWVPVRCHVTELDGFSAHADRSELLRWLRGFSQAPKRTFVVHGEPLAAESLAQALRHDRGWSSVIVPEYLESDVLFTGI
ncbi:MBL fold metallo-hydrolase RNA specificity domain-containing protein [Hymenobacter sp. BT491]|uniref:MBL fold metallo-hydrolase RNA specificity domain-containing protein n=1 Tax=Hymenobacter sp. BT491 TaxID=2766779 RepID=UPI0016534BAD|nr:MBL fold metallo-hydrolase [Hymenobacter sp. BT491]MBC6990538.1 MBL fold metallo-hydrolase [Hymenobacter sp. BT491]